MLKCTVSGFNVSDTALCCHEGVKIAPAGGRSMMSAPWDLLLRFTFCRVCKSSFQPGQRCTWKCLAEPQGAADDLNGGRGLDFGQGAGQHFTFAKVLLFERVRREAFLRDVLEC